MTVSVRIALTSTVTILKVIVKKVALVIAENQLIKPLNLGNLWRWNNEEH